MYLMDSPHKEWIQEMATRSKLANNINLMDELAQVDYDTASQKFAQYIMQLRQIMYIDLENVSKAFSVWYPLRTATEFVIDFETQYGKLSSYVYKLIPEIENKIASNRFKYPFEDIVITFKTSRGYLPYFISVFKMLEMYKNKDKKLEPIYLIKLCATKGLVKSDTTPVFSEFQYIKSLYPRVIINCKPFSNCGNRVSRNIASFLPSGELLKPQDSFCFTSWTYADSCPHTVPSPIPFIPEGVTYAKDCHYIASIVTFVLDMFNSKRIIDITPESRDGVSQRTNKNKQSTVQSNKRSRVLFITTIGKRYNSTGTGATHKNHKSPVEHVRRAHYRRLKNGRVIPVKQAVVNKGSLDKPTYIITD